MKLSIVMIVKNEEKYLEEVLSSLKEIRDHIKTELIIVDTGSTDRTVQIAKRYTEKVYFHQWNNDFGSMRNKTIEYATGEWLLVLDGDEVFQDSYPIIEFLKYKQSKNYNAATITIRSITDEEMNDVSAKVDMLRLFRKTKEFQYKGTIHEQPQYKEPVFFTEAEVLHYGYLATDKALMELKFERNKALLQAELERDPENIYLWFQLSQTYGMHKEYKKALDTNLKAYNSAKKQNVNLKDYMYVYTHMAHMYYLNDKYVELEGLCLEALEVEEGHIDLYYYLGKAQKFLNKDKKCITSYKKYLDLLEQHRNNQRIKGANLTKTTLAYYEDVYLDLSIAYKRLDLNEKALEYAKKVKKEYMYPFIMPHLIELHVDMEAYEHLQTEYDKIDKNNYKMQQDFWICLENTSMKLNKEQKYRIEKIFSQGEGNYTLLNKVRLYMAEDNQELSHSEINNIKQLNFAQLPIFFVDAIYFLMKRQDSVGEVLYNIREDVMQLYVEFLFKQHDNFSHDSIQYIQNTDANLSLSELRFQKVLMRNLLLLDKLEMKEFRLIWSKYIQYGTDYIAQIYHPNIFDNEMVYDVKNDEDAFLLYMVMAKKYEHTDTLSYIRYVRQALKVYPYMKKGVELLIDEVKAVQEETPSAEKDKLQEYRVRVKDSIREFINNGDVDSATSVIEQYQQMIPNDLEIYAMKSVILMMQGYMEEAEKVILEGLEINSEAPDLLYNLKYLYETMGETAKANEVIVPVKKTAEDELQEYKKVVKKEIECLIEQERLEEAKEVIIEYEKIIKNDPDIYAIQGVIAIIEGDITKAEGILKSGLEIEPSHCNLLYNIAYLYEMQDDDVMAYKYYKDLNAVASGELVQEVRLKIKRIQDKGM